MESIIAVAMLRFFSYHNMSVCAICEISTLETRRVRRKKENWFRNDSRLSLSLSFVSIKQATISNENAESCSFRSARNIVTLSPPPPPRDRLFAIRAEISGIINEEKCRRANVDYHYKTRRVPSQPRKTEESDVKLRFLRGRKKRGPLIVLCNQGRPAQPCNRRRNARTAVRFLLLPSASRART